LVAPLAVRFIELPIQIDGVKGAILTVGFATTAAVPNCV
jgi:hypothetical protein